MMGPEVGVTVTAVLFGMHRAFLPPGARQEGRVDLRYAGDGVTLAVVMSDLGMPAETASIVFLDGQPIAPDHMLKDGDSVAFVSPVSGG